MNNTNEKSDGKKEEVKIWSTESFNRYGRETILFIKDNRSIGSIVFDPDDLSIVEHIRKDVDEEWNKLTKVSKV